MVKVFTDINSVEENWDNIRDTIFLRIDFLKAFYNAHQKLKHLFIIDDNMRLYAHVFHLRFDRAKEYLLNNLVFSFILRFINFKVLYLTNSFITNVPAFITKKKISLKQVLNSIKEDYSLIVIPDFLFEEMQEKDSSYTKIEVEEEMVLEIKGEWKLFDDYILALRSKYRKKINRVIINSSSLEVKLLDLHELDLYTVDMQKLFVQVIGSSRFKGSEFNVSCLHSLVERELCKVYGYFLGDRIVGFSSEIEQDERLYSYYVGFDKSLNQSLSIYGRILIETIKHGIQLQKNKLLFGRTANEYKTNFGAIPIRSFVYIRANTKVLNFILKPLYYRLSIKPWKQRKPFKRVL